MSSTVSLENRVCHGFFGGLCSLAPSGLQWDLASPATEAFCGSEKEALYFYFVIFCIFNSKRCSALHKAPSSEGKAIDTRGTAPFLCSSHAAWHIFVHMLEGLVCCSVRVWTDENAEVALTGLKRWLIQSGTHTHIHAVICMHNIKQKKF